ncbi:MAG: SGNH/GDSL hydrolase family protein [Chthoniobacterales bacterium]
MTRLAGVATEGIRSFFDARPFQAVKVRSGLPSTRGKLESGSSVVIGFLVGSITQNAEPRGFVSALRDHLHKQFPSARIVTVNAGLAGTDSAWGAKRIGRDLLVERPDLVFVEFAVNDGERDDSAADMELIVRRIHDANRAAEVAFLYVTSDTAFRKLAKTKVPKAIREHEKVADHYGIPSITFGSDLFAKSRLDNFAWGNFFHDACHPKPEGYESYTRDLVAATDQLLHSGEENTRKFPEPLTRTSAASNPERTISMARVPEAPREMESATAKGKERMPTFGTVWIENPFSRSASGSEWRLEYTVLGSVPSEADPALLGAQWHPARWFGEVGGFTGKRSRLIAESYASTGSKLSIMPFLNPGSVEVPQVVWSPAKAGRYLIEVSASKILGHVNGPPAMAGIEIFSRNANGAAKKRASVSSGDGESLKISKELLLQDGEDLVVRPFAKGYEYVQLEGFNVVTSALNSSSIP